MEYPALFEPAGEGGFVITFPDFGWGITQGDTENEGREMAVAALQTMIEEHIRKGEDLPRATRPRGRKYRTIRLPALQELKAELYVAFRVSGMKKAALARRLGIPRTTIDRLFDFNNHTRLEQIEAAFAVLDKRLIIGVSDKAA
ncbi:MAG: type II toxin-antitoxin system HicB family antitoxin [Bryobacteraceae bacterium]|jgi:antitoxin HicB